MGDHHNSRAMRGDVIAGRYRLLEPLGEGAMSSVWLAEDGELGRRVAVKMLGPAADRARFEREARAAAALSSPHIVQLYDYGEHGGRPFMVLEHLGGGTLEERLPRGTPLPDDEAQRIAAEIAAGLAHAHARGLVHRDLKPANVLFDGEDRAKIADFGIARMGGAGTLTEAGTVLGTASYISPEQAAGEPATPASDVYSFGVILFRMLTGRLPFESRNAMELVRMHRDETPPTVRELRDDAPPRLEVLALASLAKDPTGRPPDGRALLSELSSPDDTGTLLLAPSTAETAATQVVRPRPPRRGGRRWLPVAIAAAAVLLLAGAAVAFVATGDGDNEEPAPTTTPSLTLPTVTAETTLDTSTEETTEPTTTEEETTTQRTTTERQPTTTTAPTTTAPPTTTQTTAPTTTAPPPTTTETLPTTTETLPTTTETTPTDTTITTTPGATG
jgi:eukaryotic-like serine/threonine-protein kinase